MSNTLLALTLYCTWALLLVVAIAALRVYYSSVRRHPVNRFATSGEDLSPFSGRLCRAHANCYENLGVFGGFVLVAVATDQLSLLDSTALWVFAARVAQSSVHLISTRARAVLLRFACFAAQLILLVRWAALLVLA